jgi:acetyltransferase
MAEVLSKQPRPKGPRLSIITNAGGPGVLATDALILAGGELSPISPQTLEQLNGFLPAAWSRNNPIDILGDADPERYAKSLEVAAQDPASDGLLVILTPQDMTDPTQTAEKLRPYAKIQGKPILASWMGGPVVTAGENILNSSGIPTYPYPDTAARAFYYMWKYSYNLRGLYETPSMATDAESAINRDAANAIIQNARQEGRTILTEVESKKLLSTYGIPTVLTSISESADQAVEQADRIGYPVVLKLYSRTITHKTDVGGVKLNLRDSAAVRDAFAQIQSSVGQKAGADHFHGVSVQPMVRLDGYEIIIGSSIDPQFGPVLLFGTGGQLVEIFKDRALGLPPLNATLARRMIEQTRIYKALKGVRGRPPVDLAALEHLLVRFSQLVVEQKWIKEIDINPLLASDQQLIALDARVVVHGPDVGEQSLPRPAIRPYPTQYITPWTLKDGASVTIRPIRPEDEPLLVQFHQTLSERSVRLRYFHHMKLNLRTTHERLTRVCFNDYDRDIALVADHHDPATGRHEILGVARLGKLPFGNQAEFAMLISDQWQNRGLGSRMLDLLIQVGRDEKLSRIVADILPDNLEMQRICKKLGFTLTQDPLAPVIKAAIAL